MCENARIDDLSNKQSKKNKIKESRNNITEFVAKKPQFFDRFGTFEKNNIVSQMESGHQK